MSCLVSYSDSSEEEERNTDSRSKKDKFKAEVTATYESESEKCEINTNSDILTHHRLQVQNREADSAGKTKTKKFHDQQSDECLYDVSDKTHSLKSTKTCKRSHDGNVKDQLSLPPVIQCMFSGNKNSRQWIDDPENHGNRVRSFPHMEGNWATHVFIPVEKDERLVHFVNVLLHLFEPLPFEIQPEFHMSLSQTVVIRHHWIDPLVDSLKDALSSIQSCVGDLDDIKFYSNDEKTRTFLCLEVAKEDTAFVEYVSVVDKCFHGFKLPKYYEDPSFHISVAWCLGDVCHSVPERKMMKAKELLRSFCAANPELSVVFARNICCRSGNKNFLIPLIV